MGKRNRVMARKPSSTNAPESVNVLFSDLIVGSTDQHVDLESCIPYTEIRPLSSSGVRRLICLFLGTEQPHDDDEKYGSTGFCLGTDLPMVVELQGSMISIVSDFFKKEGLTDSQIETRVKSRSKWFGIVDGLHSHAALSYIKEKYQSWERFKWYVKVLNGGFTLQKYCQLARVQNGRHNPSFYVELTLFDVLYNLRLEHERLKRENKKCGGSETAEAYDGALHARSSTLQQKANICIRLPMNVLKEMGLIMNKDHPDIILASRKTKAQNLCNADQLMERQDCRLFRKFINICTLKGSSAFLNASGSNSEDIQINTLHRVKDLYLESSLKTIQPEDLTTQYKFARMAQREQDKFLKFIEDKHWPPQMIHLKHTLLRTTVLNKELEENSNNEFDILKNLLDSFRRHFPDLAAIKEAKWKESVEVDNRESNGANKDNGKGNDRSNDGSNQSDVTLEPEVEPETVQESEDENKFLDEKNIRCYNMNWRTYLGEERDDNSDRFDLLITRPPIANSRSFIRSLRQKVSEEELEKTELGDLCKFMKRTLKSAAYVILFIELSMFQEWYEALDDNGFIVMPEEFIISYKLDTLRRHKISHFPQSARDLAMIARLPGVHPSGFNPSFETKSVNFHESATRRYSMMTNVPVWNTPLTRNASKVPFDKREFNPVVFEEMIELYAPVGGSVIDPFSRTSTTGIACIRTNRSCHLIEKNKECYEAAMERLRLAALPLPSTYSIADATYTAPSTSKCENVGSTIETQTPDAPTTEAPTTVTPGTEMEENMEEDTRSESTESADIMT